MKGWRNSLRVLYLLVPAVTLGFMIELLWQNDATENEPAEGHFAVLMPMQDSDAGGVRTAIDQLAEEYRLDMEVHEFATVADQKQMLRLLTSTGVDGVLLWPISVDDADYETEILNLKMEKIPVVVVERDVARSQRDSFVGSGTTSDLMVLDQSLKGLRDSDCFVVANRSGSGNSQVVEWVKFQKAQWADSVLNTLPQDQKLRQLAQDPPDGYLAVERVRLVEENARSLQLKYALTNLFSEENELKLFFSLDESLSTTAISAKRSLTPIKQKNLQLLCYGETDSQRENLESGILDGLVTSRPDVSITIGIRYLRDICRDFWVPETMDSGIDFLTANAA